MPDVGRLENVDIREVWRNEAADFTQWMESNLDALDDILGIGISVLERERGVGTFAVDLLAEDRNGDLVAIENQLEKTDHAHLGQLVTYLSNLDAKTAIWISVDPRPEHIKAVVWLNEVTPADMSFYLIKVSAMKIGDSLAAPLFTIAAGPTEVGKEIGRKKEELVERHIKRVEFFEGLIEKCKNKTPKFASLKPSKYGWIGISAGMRGINFNYVIRKDGGQIELYIDRGKGRDEENKKIYDRLAKHKDLIEKEFGEVLIWERLDNKRACRISKRYQGVGWRDEEEWPELQDKTIDDMVRFDKALKPQVKALSL